MLRWSLASFGFAAIALMTNSAMAQMVAMKWGLENEWSYYETRRAAEEDLSVRSKAPKEFRAFAFKEREREVLDPWLACLQGYERLWSRYQVEEAKGFFSAKKVGEPGGAEAARARFQTYVAKEDPKCVGQIKKTAPRLYFDFTTDSDKQLVLEQVEVTTLQFSEYRGGGFATKEVWYDILLSHKQGTKQYSPEPRLVLKGFGRVMLRLWSDNFYPNQGWMAPMGEYTIDVRFVFSVAGKTVNLQTGPFKIDV